MPRISVNFSITVVISVCLIAGFYSWYSYRKRIDQKNLKPSESSIIRSEENMLIKDNKGLDDNITKDEKNEESPSTQVSSTPTVPTEPLKRSPKVDENGHYLRFRGVTIVAPIGDRNKDFFKILPSRLAKDSIITKYISLLPVDSYHMTTTNLHSHQRSDEDWNEFIERKKRKLQKLDSKLKRDAFNPLVNLVGIERSTTAVILVVDLDTSQQIAIKTWQLSMIKSVKNEFQILFTFRSDMLTREQLLT